MPLGIAGVVVAIAGYVVEIVAHQRGCYANYPAIVEQLAQVFVLVDETDYARPLVEFVRLAVVAAAMVGPDLLEVVDDGADVIGEQAGDLQESESVEELKLLFIESQSIPSSRC
jgi:hypothetical protein